MAFTDEEKTSGPGHARLPPQESPPGTGERPDGSRLRNQNQSVEIFLLRTILMDPSQSVGEPIAKATYVKKSGIWKIYWQRGDMKWYIDKQYPGASSLEIVLQVVEEDPYGCFWG